eukprot:scaffold29980_cov26-Tisochrysis_lutea.AAC.3
MRAYQAPVTRLGAHDRHQGADGLQMVAERAGRGEGARECQLQQQRLRRQPRHAHESRSEVTKGRGRQRGWSALRKSRHRRWHKHTFLLLTYSTHHEFIQHIINFEHPEG